VPSASLSVRLTRHRRRFGQSQRAWSLEDSRSGRCRVTEILDVVTKPVDEEISAGIDAADDEFVPIPSPDGSRRWNVTRHVGEALEALVANVSFVTTVMDCGMFTSGVLVLVAIEVLLA